MSNILKGLNEGYFNRDEQDQQNAMDTRRRSDLSGERNAGLNEPDELPTSSAETRNGVYEYDVPTGQEKIAQALGLQLHKGHWFSRVPVQKADFQFGRPQFHEIASKNVSEAEQDYGPEYQDKVKRLGQMAKQGERKTVWDPVKRVYKTVPVNPPKEQGVTEAELDEAKAKRTVEDIFIKGKKVGSITTTTTQSGMIFYTAQVGNSFVAGPDTREEALKHLKRLYRDSQKEQGVAEGSLEEQVYKVVALDKSNALAKPVKLKVKASSIEDVFSRLATNDWYALSINGVEVVAGKRLKQGLAEGSTTPKVTFAQSTPGSWARIDILVNGVKQFVAAKTIGPGFWSIFDLEDENIGSGSNKSEIKSAVLDYLSNQGLAEGSSTMWEVSFDYGPHQSETVKVKAKSAQEAVDKVETAAEKKGRSIMVNWARPAEQSVAEGVRDLGYDAQSLIMKLRRDVEEKRLQPTPQAVLAAARELAGDMDFAPQLLVKQVLGQGVAEAVTLDRSKNSSYPNDPATVKHRLDSAKAILSDPNSDSDSRRAAAAIIAKSEKGVAEGGYPEVDHMPGPTIKRTQTGCKRCHGKGYVYKTDDGEVHPMNRPDAKKYKCGKCSGIGFVKSDVAEEKIKGADGKACWPGYRYNGTENGKDDCVKVKESSILEGLQQVDEINWKHAAAAGAMALGALGGAGQAQAQFNPSGLSDVYLQQVVSGEHQRPMVSIDAAKAELQARMNGKQQKVSPQSDSGSSKPFTPVDYQTKEPLKKGADGKWYNSNGEERDGLHGGPISAQGTAMHRGLKLRQ